MAAACASAAFAALPSTPDAARPCSGHGTCVNVSAAVSPHFNVLCACDAGYTGAGDLYDARVAVDPATGKTLALDCVLPVAVSSALMSLVVLVVALRLVATGCAIYLKLNRAWSAVHNNPNVASSGLPMRIRATLSRAKRDPMVGLLLLDFGVATPANIASLAIRYASNQEATLGSDVAFTVLWVVPMLLQTLIWNVTTYRAALSLIKSRAMRADVSDTLAWRVLQFPLITLFGYVVFVGALPFGMLGLDSSRGPMANGQYILLIVRGLGNAATHIAAAVQSMIVVREARTLLGQLSPRNVGDAAAADAGPKAAEGGGGSDDQSTAAMRVLRYLEHTTREFAVSAVVGVLLTAVASVIPVAWPWQCISIALGMTLNQWKSSAAVDVLRAHRAQHRVKASSANSPVGVGGGGGGGAGSSSNNSAPTTAPTRSNNNKNNNADADDGTANTAAGSHVSTRGGVVGVAP